MAPIEKVAMRITELRSVRIASASRWRPPLPRRPGLATATSGDSRHLIHVLEKLEAGR